MTPENARAETVASLADLSEFPHWQGERRRDGVQVRFAFDRWMIIPPDRRTTIVACPCCDKPLWHERSAKRLADAMYPLAGSA